MLQFANAYVLIPFSMKKNPALCAIKVMFICGRLLSEQGSGQCRTPQEDGEGHPGAVHETKCVPRKPRGHTTKQCLQSPGAGGGEGMGAGSWAQTPRQLPGSATAPVAAAAWHLLTGKSRPAMPHSRLPLAQEDELLCRTVTCCTDPCEPRHGSSSTG